MTLGVDTAKRHQMLLHDAGWRLLQEALGLTWKPAPDLDCRYAPIFAQHSGNRSDDDLSRCEHANLGAGHSVSLKRSAHLIRHQTGLSNLDFQGVFLGLHRQRADSKGRCARQGKRSSRSRGQFQPHRGNQTLQQRAHAVLAPALLFCLSIHSRVRASGASFSARSVTTAALSAPASKNAFEPVRLRPPMETNGIGATWCFHSLIRSSPCDAHSSS